MLRLRPASLVPAFLLLALAAIALPFGAADAAEALRGRTYHFGTHEARTNITFVSEADLETIHGVTHKMSGSVTVNAAGTSGSGDLRVDVRNLTTGIDLRDEHLRSAQWLDANQFPTIRLQMSEIVEDEGGRTWSWKGRLTVKGVTKDVKGKAKVRPIPDALGKQLGAGSWVRVRTGFDIRLSDHGVAIPSQVGAKVSEVWEVKVDLYGSTQAPTRR